MTFVQTIFSKRDVNIVLNSYEFCLSFHKLSDRTVIKIVLHFATIFLMKTIK